LSSISPRLQLLVALMMRTLPFLATQAWTKFVFALVFALAGAAENANTATAAIAARTISRKYVFICPLAAFE
jgi:hypothetical protein